MLDCQTASRMKPDKWLSFILPMDVRAKQRLCYLGHLFTFSGLSGGFAPRHLRRYAPAL